MRCSTDDASYDSYNRLRSNSAHNRALDGAELAALIEGIKGRAYKVTSIALIRNETGQSLSHSELDNRLEDARIRAAKALDDAGKKEAAAAVRVFQSCDLRAKAGTDKADATDLREAQQRLGHKSAKTTEIYLRARAGEKVTPMKLSTELRNSADFAEQNNNAKTAKTRVDIGSPTWARTRDLRVDRLSRSFASQNTYTTVRSVITAS